jgi:hypothetical protein
MGVGFMGVGFMGNIGFKRREKLIGGRKELRYCK